MKKWNDERGFGFLETDDQGAEIFVHIKAFTARSGRPEVGQAFFFDIEPGPQGKKRAARVEPARAVMTRANRRRELRAGRAGPALLALPAFAIVYVVTSVLTRPPLAFVAVYLIASLTTFLAYALDKAAARREAQRIPESTLHALALAGGWPGALLAQTFLRHKSAKTEFLRVFWVTVVANVVGFVVLCHWLAAR